jgi:SAM-dependent methyltransferase
MSTTTQCDVCQGNQAVLYLEKAGYRIFQCQHCGFLYVHPRPGREVLKEFYQNPEYFQGIARMPSPAREDENESRAGRPCHIFTGADDYGYADYSAERERIESDAAGRLAVIERLSERGKLLDLGCAAGFFLKAAIDRGWSVEGVEISGEAARSAAALLGQRVYSSVSAASFPPESFDVVTLWEYIEHVPDPREDLRQVNQLLKPGGLVALSTPNAGTQRVKRHPERWREFKPPEHLSFFSVHTLQRLLRECGLGPVVTRGIVPKYEPSDVWQRVTIALQNRLGDRHARKTPFWWVYSLLRRLVLYPTIMHHHLVLSEFEYCEGIEVYARKVAQTF